METLQNKEEALTKLDNYLVECINTDKIHSKKANLISYWIKNFTDYQMQEETFNSSYLKEYKRGDIIKVNLGFRIGNEEGGLHYCVVLDKKNAKQHSTLTVIPLTSQKDGKKINSTSVLLGNEIYISILSKANSLLKELDREKISENEDKLSYASINDDFSNIKKEDIEYYKKITKKIAFIEKMLEEIKDMKKGSIALINQITTISKQRIYNPKKDVDILSEITLSEEKMNLIDEKLKKLYLN